MFNIDASMEIRRTIKQLYTTAHQQGRSEEFTVAIRQVYERLSHDPLQFGEPLYSLPKLRLQIRAAALVPLAVVYSISIEHRFVVIMNIKLMTVNSKSALPAVHH